MRPNLFDYATKELSQDAFLAWYFRWADEQMSDDLELQKNARSFLSKYIREQYPDYDSEIVTVQVRRQVDNIDLLLLINGNLNIIIEDKTNTGDHDNQLQRYAKSVKGNTVKLYIKTGDESAAVGRRIVSKEGYTVIYRKDLLSFWESCKSTNEIFVSFIERMSRIETRIHSYKNNDVWSSDDVRGFFMDLEQAIHASGWHYAANARGGDWVLNWKWVTLEDVQMYLEFSFPCWCANERKEYTDHFKLKVKIHPLYKKFGVQDKDKVGMRELNKRLQHKHIPLFARLSNGLTQKPHHPHPGTWMTIAEVPFRQFASSSSEIDIDHIAHQLQTYEVLLDQYSEYVTDHRRDVHITTL